MKSALDVRLRTLEQYASLRKGKTNRTRSNHVDTFLASRHRSRTTTIVENENQPRHGYCRKYQKTSARIVGIADCEPDHDASFTTCLPFELSSRFTQQQRTFRCVSTLFEWKSIRMISNVRSFLRRFPLQMNSFVYAKACEEYELGLSLMLRIAKGKECLCSTSSIFAVRSRWNRSWQNENSSQRRTWRECQLRFVSHRSFFFQISHYLSRAETCKKRLETQRWEQALEKIKTDSAADHAILDRTTGRKSFSISSPTCRFQ